jgi:hypothetical protein
LQYWQAFSLINDLRPEEEKAIEAWKSGPPNAEVEKILNASSAAFLCLRRGAKLAHCDWGLYYEDGPGLLLPYVQKARDLARRAALRARASFEQGKTAEGLEDVLASFALARHVGSDGVMISLLVQFSIEAIAQEAIAPYLLKLDAKGLQQLTAGLDQLPEGGDLRKTYQMEKKHMVGWIIKQLKDRTTPELLDKLFLDKAEGDAILKAVGGKENALKLLRELETYYDGLDQIMTLPRAQRDAEIDKLNKTVEGNAFAKLLLPALGKVTQADDKARTRRALLKAAIAVLQGGPDKLKDHKDPFGDGHFEYETLPDGFELKSKLIDAKNQRVTLRVGGK